MPPKPFFSSTFSSRISTFRPAASPSAFARSANSAGNRWLGGVFTKFRAVATASAIATERESAAFAARSRVEGTSSLPGNYI